MTIVAETPVTHEAVLQETLGNLLANLTPALQHVLTRQNNFYKPRVICKDSSLIIEDWPFSDTHTGLRIVENILHCAKHYYAHGDRSGHRGIAQKRQENQELENINFRMCISYTYSIQMESQESPRQLIINFYVSHPDAYSPCIAIGRIDPHRFTDDELKAINAIAHVNYDIRHGDTVALTQKMTNEEEATYLKSFIDHCAQQISDYLSQAYLEAVQFGKQTGIKLYPDYE